jgi:hydroxyacylglutathione hydrolase
MSESKYCAIFNKVTINPEGVADIQPQELQQKKSEVHMIDVRRPDEFVGELGHIPGAKLSTLETDLTNFLKSVPEDQKSDSYVFVCRSGGRSSRAASMALSLGFKRVYNLTGGMIYWNELRLETER